MELQPIHVITCQSQWANHPDRYIKAAYNKANLGLLPDDVLDAPMAANNYTTSYDIIAPTKRLQTLINRGFTIGQSQAGEVALWDPSGNYADYLVRDRRDRDYITAYSLINYNYQTK